MTVNALYFFLKIIKKEQEVIKGLNAVFICQIKRIIVFIIFTILELPQYNELYSKMCKLKYVIFRYNALMFSYNVVELIFKRKSAAV